MDSKSQHKKTSPFLMQVLVIYSEMRFLICKWQRQTRNRPRRILCVYRAWYSAETNRRNDISFVALAAKFVTQLSDKRVCVSTLHAFAAGKSRGKQSGGKGESERHLFVR